MAETHYRQQQITAALTQVRIQMQNEASRLRRTLDVKQHILASIKNHPWEWTSCAAIFGWILAGLPARKKKIFIHSSSQKPPNARVNGPVGKVWKEVWKISKPLIAAYLAKLVADQTSVPKTEVT